jgi:hypothetical protein
VRSFIISSHLAAALGVAKVSIISGSKYGPLISKGNLDCSAFFKSVVVAAINSTHQTRQMLRNQSILDVYDLAILSCDD